MRKLLLILFISFPTLFIKAQTNLDSLYSVWQDETQTDSVRAAAYRGYIINGFLYSNPDTAFILAEDLVVFGQEKKSLKSQASGYHIQGVSCYFTSNYPKALDYYQRSLKIFKEIGGKKGISNTLMNIGSVYQDQNNYLKALVYFQRSLKINEEVRDNMMIANALHNIGSSYQAQNNYPKALDYFQRSLKIFKEIGYKKGVSTSLVNIGSIYKYKSNYPKALDYYQRGLKIREEIGDKKGIANTLKDIGGIYIAQSNYQDAISQCQKSLDLSEEIGAIDIQESACSCLYDAHKAMGHGNEALVYLEKMNVLDDSLHAEETTSKLQQMEFAKQMLQDSIAQAETDRLVLEVHQEEIRAEEKTRNIAFGIGFVVLLFAVGIYTRLRYVRKSKANLQVEKDRSENLLLNILPADIAAELKEKGRADARDFDMVSILFTDFKGFTAASEKLSAQELVAEINTCFEAFDGIMDKYKVEKIKTIGDAYMAAGGLPVPTDDSTKNTILAALEMQSFISSRKAAHDAKGEPAFEMRVGIHTGPVVAGIVGVKKFQYDIWGDTVNTASRMESAGEVGKVNVSQSTYELLKNDPQFSFESRGKIEAKGKGEIEMFFIALKN
ncbi:MAG: adenylate cyclase [Sphingobacteriales bacterium]|jgi:adenylate cyclase